MSDDLEFRWGKVTATSPLRVQLDGDSSAVPVTPDSFVDPLTLAVNDRVRCELAANRLVVHGKAGSSFYSRAQADAAFYSRSQVAALLAHRNQVINGAMSIWQRGTSFTNPASGSYLADRFRHVFDGSGSTRTITQQAFAAGSEVCEAPFFLQYAQSVAGSGGTVSYIETPIEDVRVNANGTVTVSFFAKLAATATLSVSLAQFFGTGGSATVSVAAQNVAIGTTFQRYSLTFTVPAITAKTIGANNFFGIRINLPLNATFTLGITGIQSEAGAVTTPFERTPIMDDMFRCERYFEKSWALGTAPGTATVTGARLSEQQAAGNTSYLSGSITFRLRKRAVPVVHLYDTNGTIDRVSRTNLGATTTAGSAVQLDTNPDTSSIYFYSPSGAGAGGIYYHYTADAEL